MKVCNIVRIAVFLPFITAVLFSNGQDPERFKSEINAISQKKFSSTKQDKVVVFTGSSSIRMWKDVESYFPEVVAINTGFGGSHMSDLLYYLEETVLKFNPDLVFIYEGDNDIASEKKPEEIIDTAKELVAKLKEKNPDIKIVFISPKPSLARWHLKNEYMRLNSLLEKYCEDSGFGFANMWDSMLGEDGTPLNNIFIKDGLHMNKKGYNLWYKVLKEYFN